MVNRHFLFLFAFIFPTSPLFAQIANDISFEFGSACQRGHGNSVIAINNNTSDRAVVTVEISSQISDYDQITQPSVESKFQYPATDDVSLLPGERKVVGCQRLRVGNETANHQYSVSGAFISPPLSEFPKPDRPASQYSAFVFRAPSDPSVCNGDAVFFINRHPRRTIQIEYSTPGDRDGKPSSTLVEGPYERSSLLGCKIQPGFSARWTIHSAEYAD